ncbi:MAG: peptidoglycan binding domain-containing protein [Lachnospiraceae bacterium]
MQEVRGWLSYDDSGNVKLDKDAIGAFVAEMAEKYDTADKPRTFRTHGGEEVTVSGGSYGWLMDQDATYNYLIDAIWAGDAEGYAYAEAAQDCGQLVQQRSWRQLCGNRSWQSACLAL